jgi:hypothetical protein
MGFTSDPPWQRDSEPSVIIIADDLSGATDSAVACAERGLDTVVALGKTDGFGAAEAICRWTISSGSWLDQNAASSSIAVSPPKYPLGASGPICVIRWKR